jgi:hypothetical protein
MAHRLGHSTGYKEVMGQTLDISKWTDFEFCDGVVVAAHTWCPT